MGKTSAAVKNRYNTKAYDRFTLIFKKGDKEKVKAHAESKGMSLNGYINELIQIDMENNIKLNTFFNK